MRDDRITLGNRVRDALQRRGWRQVDLATAAGVDKGAISRIVAGKQSAGRAKLDALASALECTREDLLPGADEGGSSAEYVRTAATRPGHVLVEMRRELPIAEAMEIQRLADCGES